jgi:uncharacterized protein (DUF433 family)
MAHERIEVNATVRFGKPVIRGTRITVEQILRELSLGMSVEQLIAEHPHLTPDDVRAACAYAADVLSDEDVILM